MPRASLFQGITRSWPIKAAALFLALMLYVAVQLQQPVTANFDVALNVQLPPGRALVQKPPKVYAQISGKGTQILKLRSLAGDITRRVPDTLTATTWVIHLAPTDVELELPKGADVRVMEVRPSEITLALDSVARKDVRIVSLVTVTLDSSQLLPDGLSMTPNMARLVGPGTSLAAIESVTTVPMEIASVSGTFSRTVPIDTMPLGIVRIAPKQVTVTGELTVIAERSFAGVPVETGAGAITNYIVTPARVTVSVRGPEARVQTLTRDSVRVVAHITGASGSGATGVSVARITVIGPRGLTARAVPDSVTVRRRTTSRRG
ncbi:MAG TPA: YbbR-like domain-containing protein [Gemmatimonadales bacterium]|nr:YbbR-like domain-containing protein [Gemmatimonadales bacterium]